MMQTYHKYAYFIAELRPLFRTVYLKSPKIFIYTVFCSEISSIGRTVTQYFQRSSASRFLMSAYRVSSYWRL